MNPPRPVRGGCGVSQTPEHLKLQANYVRAFGNKYNTTAQSELEIGPTVFQVREQVYF